jgi:hypothetical protein
VEALLSVASARVRWARCLDDAAWDRDALTVRQCAETLTAELLPLEGAGPVTDPQLHTLLADLEASGLREPVLQGRGTLGWVPAYLSRHGDPGFWAALNPAVLEPRDVALELAARGSPWASAHFVRVWAGQGVIDREALCEAALRLPTSSGAALGGTVLTAWRGARVPITPACMLLAAEAPGGLAFLRTQSDGGGCVADVAAMMLAARGDRSRATVVARRQEAAGTAPGAAPQGLGVCSTALGVALGVALASLDPRQSVLRWVPRWLLTRGGAGHPLVQSLLLSWRDPSLVEALPATGPRLGAAVRGFLGAPEPNASDPTGAATGAEGWAWRTAADEVLSCARPACLRPLLLHRGDELAARAAFALGAAGLEALPVEDTRPLLRRMLALETPWLTAAVVLSLRRLAPAWTGLGELLRGQGLALADAERHTGLMLRPFVLALLRRAPPRAP